MLILNGGKTELVVFRPKSANSILLCHRLSLSGRRPFIAASLAEIPVHCLISI